MHPTLLTQLLGKVGEAWLTHAKAINLPSLLEQAVLSWFMLAASFWRKGGTAHCNSEGEFQPQPVWKTGVLLACLC